MAYDYKKKNDCPCHNCQDRCVNEYTNCHSNCERYITWKNKLHQDKVHTQMSINPENCSYFKTKTSTTAKVSKHRYR